jgi:hypothetical protein
LEIPVSRRARIILVGVGAAATVAAAAVLVWALVLRDTARPVSVEDAVSRYRARAVGGSTPIPTGVYVYETRGEESISALGGTTHAYPAESAITVDAAGCGMSLTWDVLEERSSSYTVCVDGGELTLPVWSERHRFFGRDDESEWRCDDVPWLPGALEPGSTVPYRCASDETVQEGTLTVVGTEPVQVGSERVDALHLRIEAVETGAAEGTLVEDRWLEPVTGLPLRIAYDVDTMNESLIGDVRFEERYELVLTSLEPRT